MNVATWLRRRCNLDPHEVRAELAEFRDLINQLKELLMATQDTLAHLTATVAANTNATQAATQALNGFVQSTSDLTAKLQAALAGDDDAAVQAAADAIDANNKALAAAVPSVATAVAANTPAA